MELAYKEDWPAARRRWCAYWQGEIIDRPVMLITVPQPNPAQLPQPPDDHYRWMDIPYQVRVMEARNRSTRYLGEAIPPVHGPMAAWSAYYGGPVRYMPDTIWFEPFVDSYEHAPDWDADWQDGGYLHLRDMVHSLAQSRRGEFFVGFPPTMHTAPSDLLSSMRGVDRYLMDLIEYPDQVRAATMAMSRNFGRIFADLYSVIHAHGYEGYGNWWPIWSPEPLGVFQSDVSCMLSASMFEDFVVPHLEATAAAVTHSCYHLDGPDAIRHAGRVCEVAGIHTIQWVPGSGTRPGAMQWLELFRTIQARGRSVYFGLSPHELEDAIRELDPRRIILAMGAGSVQEAEDLLSRAEAWTARYWGGRV